MDQSTDGTGRSFASGLVHDSFATMQGGSPEKQSGSAGWLIVVAVVVGLFVLIKVSGTSSKPAAPLPFANVAQMPSEGAKVTPPEMTALAGSDLKSARGTFSKVAALGDPTSAMVYSKNCYAALSKAFSWSKLDRCGGFDAIVAQQVINDAMSGSDEELAYFESEATAQRYLASGIASGGAASAMDERWEGLGSFARNTVENVLAAVRAADASAEASEVEGEAAAALTSLGSSVDAEGSRAVDSGEGE